MSPSREQFEKLANDFIAAFNTNTPEGVIALRSPNCQHHILPTTAKHPVRSNAEYQDFIVPGFQIVENLHLRQSDGVPFIVDVETRRVVLNLKSSAETPIGPYFNEYTFTLRTNDEGTEIVEIVEFFDSAYTAEFMEKIMKYTKEVTEEGAKADA